MSDIGSSALVLCGMGLASAMVVGGFLAGKRQVADEVVVCRSPSGALKRLPHACAHSASMIGITSARPARFWRALQQESKQAARREPRMSDVREPRQSDTHDLVFLW
jgi:hypothetical protein